MPDPEPLVDTAFEEEHSLLVLRWGRPPANVLDTETLRAMRGAVAEGASRPRCASILFAARGAHFSYGASIEEHRTPAVRALLAEFHGLLRDLEASRRVCLAAVRGRCLGGGLELAAFCHRVVVAPDATLGQPEIRLGVLAPAGSVILPRRIGAARAEDLLLSGRTVGADEALALGLADEVAADPETVARAWHRTHLAPHSASSLRHAVAAARVGLLDGLAAVEAIYLEELMATEDAPAGIDAFLAKRAPAWRHR